MEQESIPRYRWLLQHTQDEDTKQILETALLHTRRHEPVFTYVVEMEGLGM